MKKLHRKLLRDLFTLRWQIVTIAVVVAAGVAVLVSAFGTYRSLFDARTRFYAAAGFPQVFSRVARAPEHAAEALRSIDGVAAVETRLTFEVPLDIEGMSEPVSATVLSLAPRGRPAVTRLVVEVGRLPEPAARRECVVNEAFAKAHRLSPGARIHVVLNGQREDVTIVGVVLSAEHLAALRGGAFIPDDAHFGVLWLPYDAVASAFQATGTFNEAVIRLAPGVREERVIAEVDRVLMPYGGYGAHGRSEQPAHRFIEGELGELEVMATVLPLIFLGVASFLLNVVLARIVVQERTQVATLRALGLRVGPIVRHYLALAAITAGLGSALGVALGAALGYLMTNAYRPFFRFPDLAFALDPEIAALGIAVSVGAGMLGALASARRIARLAPAEAMQPAAPTAFRRGLFERLRLARLLAPSELLVVRNLLAHPGRSATAVAGVAAAMAILMAGAFWTDAFALLMAHEFRLVRREDATIAFTHPLDERAVRELAHIPGIRGGEGLRDVPVRMAHGTTAKRVSILGLPEASRLHRLVAADGSAIALPPDGILLSRHLARALRAARGDRITIDALEGARARREVTVSGVVDELVGMAAYMTVPALAALLREAPNVSVALVAIDPGRERQVHEALKALPAVAAVTIKAASVRLFDEQMSSIVRFFSAMLTLFGAAIVAGVVYNAARILVAERARELATFRVIGFTRGDISHSLLLELGIQVAFGIPLGAAFGYGLCAMAVRLFGPEDMAIPLVIGPRTWALAIGVVLGAAVTSALLVRRRLDELDLVTVLKVRE